MYYRVAIQVDPLPIWKWKSTALSSLNILLHWLQYYRVLPHDRLRIFSSSSPEELHEQLVRENQGFLSTSAMATQFLQERMLAPREVVREDQQVRREETSERPPSLPLPSHRLQRAAEAHWTSEGMSSNVGQVAIMTSRTGSRWQLRCHKSWPGRSFWSESSRETCSRKSPPSGAATVTHTHDWGD